MLALYLLAAGGIRLLAGPDAQAIIAQADALYQHREDPASAKQAAALYEQISANNFEAAWKLARADYWIATSGPDKDRKDAREKGVKAGDLAIKLDPSRPEGYFWMAADLGEVAQNSFFLTAGSKAGRVKDALEQVLKMAPAWQDGSADRALGEWYYKVPGIAGGDHKQAEDHLRASLKYNPKSTASLYFLAEVIADDAKRKDEARGLLQQVLDAPIDPEWAPEDRQFKQKATALLAKLNKK